MKLENLKKGVNMHQIFPPPPPTPPGEILKRGGKGKKNSPPPPNTTPEKFENATITGHYVFMFEENSDREFKLCFQSIFYPHYNAWLEFSNFSGLKSAFQKLRFSVDSRPSCGKKAAFFKSL